MRTSCFSPVDAAAGQEGDTSRGVPLLAHSSRSSPSVPRVDWGINQNLDVAPVLRCLIAYVASARKPHPAPREE